MKNSVKTSILLFILFSCFQIKAQDSLNITVYYHDFIDTLTPNYGGNFYSECWGFEHNNKDYGVIASTAGVHFYDVTDPLNCSQVAFVGAELQGNFANWRDYHDYQNYLYTVSDVYGGSLQIIDFSELPNGVNVVYDSQVLFKEAHNIFIDTATARLYACGGERYDGSDFDLAVYDISDPINPVHLIDFNDVGYVHDCFVRNDTAYLEAPNNQEMVVVNFADIANPTILGSINYYTDMGYTHSGWLTEDGNYYILLDETVGLQIKMLDVSDLTDIQEIDVFGSYTSPTSMAHNVIIRNNFAYVSYYNDGVQIFDISDPTEVVRTGYYDTYSLPDTINYKGIWGVYPFADGKVIASDRTTGLYVFNANEALNNNAAPVSNFDFNYANNQITFSDNSINNGSTYFWDFGNGTTSIEANPTITFDQSLENQFVNVCLTVTNNSGSDVYCDSVLVAFAPIANFNTSGTVEDTAILTFSDSSLHFPTSWFWDFGFGANPPNSNNLNETVIYTNQNFNANVCLTVTNLAGSNTYCDSINVAVELVDIADLQNSNFSLYPNPVNDFLQLETNLTIESITVFDSKIRKVEIIEHNNSLDFSNFNNGIYFVELKTEQGIFYKKVIKN